MPYKNQINSKEVLKDLEKKISPLLVVNNNSLKPYVEVFEYYPENIYQQPLGSLVGFFEIKEYSEDSAYVVNFLTSVLKKEYYINPKRPVTESLDSALHKVNLALSELAKHGNIEWLGKLNAVICVLEKNNAHFSVAGNAKMFLYRNTGLTDISEDLAADPTEPHPLKTFINVSSGRLEKDDRILITTEDIFHLFTTLDLKKNLQRFEGDKFVQFLKTALSNQMEMIATMVIELKEPETEKVPRVTKKKTVSTEDANYFSEKTFIPTGPSSEIEIAEKEAKIEAETEYTDKKTGHIYVQGEVMDPMETSQFALYLESAREKMSELWYVTKNGSRKKLNIFKKQIAKKIEQRRIEKEQLAKIREEELERQRIEEEARQIEFERMQAEKAEQDRILLEKQEAERKEMEALEAQEIAEQKKINQRTKKSISSIQVGAKIQTFEEVKHGEEKELSFQEKLQLAIKEHQTEQQVNPKQAVIDLRTPQKKVQPELEIEEFENRPVNENEEIFQVPVHQQTEIDKQKRKEKIENIKADLLNFIKNSKGSALNYLLFIKSKVNTFSQKRKGGSMDESRPHLSPRFSKIKNNFSRFSTKQKLYTVIILALVFVVPFFIARYLNKPEKPTITQLPPSKPLTQADILSGEKNIKTNVQTKEVSNKENLIGSILLFNDQIVTFNKSSVLLINDSGQSKEVSLPGGNGNILKATYMKDLYLVLIATDQNKILSFSPLIEKFTENNISLSTKIEKGFFGTYLTYMYILDTDKNQVYRYPRADGGFGEKTDSLKSILQLSNVTSMAIDDSLWFANGKQVIKYFKGAPQEIKFESSQTTVNYDLIHTDLDSNSIYVLDKLNSRIVVFNKENGNIISQYHNEKLKDAVSFTINEKNKTAYAVTSSGLISISIE